jgi:hypothetical protein
MGRGWKRTDNRGRATLYPTECLVIYDERADAYHFVFKGFHPTQ